MGLLLLVGLQFVPWRDLADLLLMIGIWGAGWMALRELHKIERRER